MTKELKEQIHEQVYSLKVPTLGFSRRDLFDIAMKYAEPREIQLQEKDKKIKELEAYNKKLLQSDIDKHNKIVLLSQKVNDLQKENERFKGDLELWESGACRATNLDKCAVVKELEAQIEKMKSDVISERDETLRVEDVITYTVLNNILAKWEIK